MRKSFGAKPWTYPQPVLIIGTYDENGKPNAMNAAWGGISDDTRISICLGKDHKTVKNILSWRAFTVSMATADQVTACDYVGIVSGNDTADKMEKSGLHAEPAGMVNAPAFKELPMSVECTLVSYDEESCCLIGEIVNVAADESILDAQGKIDPDKLRPIIFDPVHSTYRVIGEQVGCAFRDGLKLR